MAEIGAPSKTEPLQVPIPTTTPAPPERVPAAPVEQPEEVPA